jgi:hypothetical protein
MKMTDKETNCRLDGIALAMTRADAINAIHACRPNHPLGRNNPYKWRNAAMAVFRSDVSSKDRDWLKKMADAEAASECIA